MAKDSEMKRKQVVFNLKDDYQKNMYEYCSDKTNFSNYVKRLIQRDMEGGQSNHSTQKKPLVEYQEPEIEVDFTCFTGDLNTDDYV